MALLAADVSWLIEGIICEADYAHFMLEANNGE